MGSGGGHFQGSDRWHEQRTRLATARYSSAENRLGVTACNTFGWTHAVSTNRVAPSSQRLSTRCFAGTRDAAKCYVYLSDVSTTKRKASDQVYRVYLGIGFSDKANGLLEAGPFKSSLPRHQLNSSLREGKRLGDKRTLRATYPRDNRNSISALRRSPSVSISASMSECRGQKSRETTREEDKAYSLLGIFGIHLPLIYGEGKEHAFKRLKKEIEPSLPGKQTINRFIFSHMLIMVCKKTSRIHSNNRVKAVYRTYG